MSNLSIIEHVVNENLGRLESKVLLNGVLSVSIECIKEFQKLAGIKSDSPDEYDEVIFPETSALLQFAEKRHSLIPVVNNVLGNALEVLEALDMELDAVLDMDAVPVETQDKLASLAEDGLSHISTFVFYEFLSTPGYDEIVYDYCGKTSIDIIEFIKEYAAVYDAHRRSLGVFNDHPEYEQPFISIVGPALALIPEDVLTIDDVTGVISGTLSVEELLSKLHITDDDDMDMGPVSSSVF